MIDWVLTAWLVIIFPAYNIWVSRRPKKVARSKAVTHLRTVSLGLAPLLVLAVNWIQQHRIVADLGLSAPTLPPALIGLGIAVLIVSGLGVSALLSKARPHSENPNHEMMARLLPQTAEEWPSFIAFCLTVGVAWEILYRGYLLWILSPIFGVAGAVVVASLAYGLAHGLSNPRRVIGSLLAAAIFTTGYAITRLRTY
jgi:membrane protease YdiL (CAAX protease family)